MEDFVSYELAKKLKEKGFNEPCYMYYDEEGNLKQNIEYDPMNSGIGIDHLLVRNSCKWAIMECIAPTISQVLKWLREEKKIHIGFGYSPRKKWRYVVMYMDDRFYNKPTLAVDGFIKIEQAALAGIVYCLDNLIIEE